MPNIFELLVRSALDADLCRRLVECPEEVFQEFDLTEEQKDLLRRPDHRLLPLLGEALARQAGASDAARSGEVSNSPCVDTSVDAASTSACATLPEMSLALTVVPCARVENGEVRGYSYAVWVNPLAEGVDPASLPAPAGTSLPGRPLAPLHAVIRISALEITDESGRPQVGLSASLRQASNIMGPAPREAAGIPTASLLGSDLRSGAIGSAVAAVHNAPREERYGRLIDLIGVLRGGEVR